MTPSEVILCSHLKNSQLGDLKFRRQESIASYVVDFYCPAKKLAVEIDGDVHGFDPRIRKDLKRQNEIEGLGIKVIRFTNSDVKEDLEAVLNAILRGAGEDVEEPPLRLRQSLGGQVNPLLEKEGRRKNEPDADDGVKS